MRTDKLLFAPLLLLAALPANAADLSKIDRTLKDEPKYTSKAPTYCLLVFGEQAKTLVWLVHDGDVVHVLDSPDGKAAKKWRQVKRPQYGPFAIGDLFDEDGKKRYKNLRYFPQHRRFRFMVNVDSKFQSAGVDRRGSLAFAASAKDAPVVHFDGPLTLDLYHTQKPLRSDVEEDLAVVVGTPGVGPGTFAKLYCDGYPQNCWPVAIIEYPAKDGGKPIVQKVRLAED
jgi:hypothetical protein